jgi:ornithine cyclodeaminase/alanine dehydrogenase-like protein (mu-crystallin family)
VQEIPTETVLRSRLVVDHRESALIETGDLIIPIQLGLLTAAELHGELGELAAGKIEGRANDEELTLFKSVGVAVQDLAAATYAFKRAEALDLGTSVPF